ncbi:MAG: hypothetical protein ACI89L_001188 [Phycisphaerales bacterium]|jgi:hypothetical protein
MAKKSAKKKTKRKTAKKTARKAPAKKAGADKKPAAVGAMTTTELRAELRRRDSTLRKLENRREKLARQLAEVEGEIRSMGGTADIGTTARGMVRRRPRNEMNLADSLLKMLTGKTMSVTDAAEKVVELGYRTTAANFRTIVNQTLIRDKRFKKISRGQYTAK